MSKRNNAICTIVTESYLPWAYSLAQSAGLYLSNLEVFILVTDLAEHAVINPPNIESISVQLLKLKELENEDSYTELRSRYGESSNFLRWSLKPVLMRYLLAKRGFEKVFCVDADIRFYNNFQFLYDELNSNNFLITPHWFNPNKNENIEAIRTTGIFNAGFVAGNKDSFPILDWWLKRCIYRCDHSNNYYNADQGYLDLMPVYFESVKIIRHLGCNVAYWNADFLKRKLQDGAYIIEFEEKQFVGVLETLNNALRTYGYKRNLMNPSIKNAQKEVSILKKMRNTLSKMVPYRITKV
jgi:hypothetical protein